MRVNITSSGRRSTSDSPVVLLSKFAPGEKKEMHGNLHHAPAVGPDCIPRGNKDATLGQK